MSALGHKRTFAVQNVMSALPPKADMCGATRDVRFVPIADMATCRHFKAASRDLSQFALPRVLVRTRFCHQHYRRRAHATWLV